MRKEKVPKRRFVLAVVIACCLGLVASAAFAKVLPGDTVEERAINGAKMYIKEHKLKEPTLTVLQNALFKNAQPKYDKQWETLTGVKIKSIPYGYTDIPSKIMAEAVAKTGQWDIFNHFPYSVPNAVGAGVMQPCASTPSGRIRRSGKLPRAPWPELAPLRPLSLYHRLNCNYVSHEHRWRMHVSLFLGSNVWMI